MDAEKHMVLSASEDRLFSTVRQMLMEGTTEAALDSLTKESQ